MGRASTTGCDFVVAPSQPGQFRMNTHDTPQDGPGQQQANGAAEERRFARRIDCAERPRRPQPASAEPAPPRGDTHP